MQLHDHQAEFMTRFLSSSARAALLVAPPGAGKTTAGLATIASWIDDHHSNGALIISDSRATSEMWRNMAQENGVDLGKTLEEAYFRSGASITAHSLTPGFLDTIGRLSTARRWLAVFDGLFYASDEVNLATKLIMAGNKRSRVLFISSRKPISTKFLFDEEFGLAPTSIEGASALQHPELRKELSRFSPSINIVEMVQRRLITLDDLSWRDFEKLISSLLEKEGYDVELMKGSKDGGVDVLATRNLGEAGVFKSVWQAKKYRSDRKIGLPIIRELADTRNELGASKGIIVTSSFLTRGALQRVERDKFLLNKVDRSDLVSWIDRTFAYDYP